MGLITPKCGNVYTIRAMKTSYGVFLNEITNKDYVYSDGSYGEPGFKLSRFMPWNPEALEVEFNHKQELQTT